MKNIYDVNIRMTTTGKMVVVVRYKEKGELKTKIEPFSEELLLKYKKQYEKQKAYETKIKNKVNMKTKTKVDINTNYFVENVMLGGAIILEMVAIGVAAYIGASSIMGDIFNDFSNMESPILPEEEIEYNIDMHK